MRPIFTRVGLRDISTNRTLLTVFANVHFRF